MSFQRVYVTVGTTKFDALISAVTSDEVLRVLKSRGCEELTLQVGQGKRVNAAQILQLYGIKVNQYDYEIESPRTDIVNASFVIGHAGAGTCMDILKHNARGLVVVNEKLMDNHQTELALQLAEEGYIFYCVVSGLAETLANIDLTHLRPYERKTNIDKFVACLNEMMTS